MKAKRRARTLRPNRAARDSEAAIRAYAETGTWPNDEFEEEWCLVGWREQLRLRAEWRAKFGLPSEGDAPAMMGSNT